MNRLLTILLLCAPCLGQAPWAGILDASRATRWDGGNVGFTIPSYSVNCSTQPSLTTGSGAAAANTTSIQNSIASCDATHNVVNIPAGTYSIKGIDFQKHNKVVVRGAGPNSTTLSVQSGLGCLGNAGTGAWCMGGSSLYAQSASVSPGNSNVCSWTSGLSQGSTSIGLSSCGSGSSLAAGMIIVLDQADDTTDPGGIWLCSSFGWGSNGQCSTNGPTANADGRVLSGVQYSEQQFALVTNVSGTCNTTCTVTIAAPGVYFNNIVSGKTPGAWWPTQVATNEGIENLTFDHGPDTTSHYGGMGVWCNQCWIKNIRDISGGLADHLIFITSYAPVIRDSYFYGSQHQGSESYSLQMLEVSAGLVENNIIQNTTSPDIKDAVTGSVSGYNYTPFINFGQNGSVGAAFPVTQATVSGGSVIYAGTFNFGASNGYSGQTFVVHGFTNLGNNGVFICTASTATTITLTNAGGTNETHAATAYFGTYMQGMYASHNSGSAFNLLEGNSTTEFIADDVWGTSDAITMFRNQAQGWQPGYQGNAQTFAVDISAGDRVMNIIGNVFGQPGFHTQYQTYATGTTTNAFQSVLNGTANSGGGSCYKNIYSLGNTDTGGLCNCSTPVCDPLSKTTMMRWGNYDTVNATTVFDNTESSPGAVASVNANSTPATHTLPSSFYLSAKPSWWRSSPYPPIGPDVTGGNMGLCASGVYVGSESNVSGNCTNGTLTSSAWGGHSNIIPAQDCYLNVMNGPPDGSGPVLPYDANNCYTGSAGQALPPSCAPGSGNYSSTQTVACTNPNSGTTIMCYSTTSSPLPATNGAGTGCSAGTQYTTALTVSTAETLSIIAGTSTLTDSPLVSYVYTFNIATPTFSPAGGSYTGAQTVTITSQAGVTICYTTDGTTPTAITSGTCSHGTSLASGGSITVSVSETVSAIGTKVGFSNSAVGTAIYSIGVMTYVSGNCSTSQFQTGSSPTWTWTCSPYAAGDAIVFQIACRQLGGTPITSTSLTAPGWTITQLRAGDDAGTGMMAGLYGAIAPSTSSATFTATFNGATNCTSYAAQITGEFTGNLQTGGISTFNAVGWSANTTGSCTQSGAAVTPSLDNESVWFGCQSTVNAVAAPWNTGISVPTYTIAEYQTLSGGASVAQPPAYAGGTYYIVQGTAIAPPGATNITPSAIIQNTTTIENGAQIH